MDEDKLNEMYREDGWGILAEAAGFNPVNTESSARNAFRFCWDLFTEEQQQKLRNRNFT